MVVSSTKKGSCFECHNWCDICKLLAIAKTIAKIIFKNLIDRCLTTSYTDHINTLRIMLEQCTEFKFQLSFNDFGFQ